MALTGRAGLIAVLGALVVLAAGSPLALLAGGLVDELFLTVSPVLAGRLESRRRLGLVEGVELLPDTRIAPRLVSLRRGGDHLFARYRLSSVDAAPESAKADSPSLEDL